MTVFTCDWSNHNSGSLTQAQANGLSAFIHKITDGDHWYEDPYFKTHITMAKDLDIPILGGYHVLWGNRDLRSQAQWYVDRVFALEPEIAEYGLGIWMSDNEPFGYNVKPSIDQVNEFNQLVCDFSGFPANSVTAYCPSWSYGNTVSGLRFPWWQSNYGSNPAGPYQQVYPGDQSSRWNGSAPMPLLQYGSNTDIGDASAYRGSYEDFMNFLGQGGNMATPEEIADAVWNKHIGAPSLNYEGPAAEYLKFTVQNSQDIAALNIKLDQVLALLQGEKPTTPGTFTVNLTGTISSS